MTYGEFYDELAEQLYSNSEKVEHYIRDGFPLPKPAKHDSDKEDESKTAQKVEPISAEDLRMALENIFDFNVAVQFGNDEELIKRHKSLNESLFSIIDKCYEVIEQFEDFMPYLTDDFENYLISQLISREAWPPNGKIFTEEDRKLLKESLEKWPLKKVNKKPQPNTCTEDIYKILSAVEIINRMGNIQNRKS